MKIFVLVKQVPNTTKVKLDKKTGNLIREGVEAIMNPEDRNAVEAAVSIKDKIDKCMITAITMGPPQAVDVLTEAMAMGVDNGILLSDILFAGADTWATSTVLAKTVEVLSKDDNCDILVLAGRQAIDGDTAQIGPQVAEELNYNQATYVTSIDVNGEAFKVIRKITGGFEELEIGLPALFTVIAEVGKPRQVNLGRLLAACEPKAAIRVMNAADLGLRADETGLSGSLTHVVKTFSPKQSRESVMIEGSPAEMASALVEKLVDARLLSGV